MRYIEDFFEKIFFVLKMLYLFMIFVVFCLGEGGFKMY